MKRLAALFLILTVVLGLCACGANIGSDSAEKAEWEKFIDDYNKWADDYINIVNKYKANPTDTSILNDYTKMVAEATEWTQKADKVTAELKDSPADATKFAAELLKIANKLADAMQ